MATGKRAERSPAANGYGGSAAGVRQRQVIRRDAAQQGGGQHDGEERISCAGRIERLGGHGGTKLALSRPNQPGSSGALGYH